MGIGGLSKKIPNNYKVPILKQLSVPQASLQKKLGQKAFLCNFWKILATKLRCFGTRFHLMFSKGWR